MESGVLVAPAGARWLPPSAQPRTLPPGCFQPPATTRLSRNAPLGVGLGWGGAGGGSRWLPPRSHPAPTQHLVLQVGRAGLGAGGAGWAET